MLLTLLLFVGTQVTLITESPAPAEEPVAAMPTPEAPSPEPLAVAVETTALEPVAMPVAIPAGRRGAGLAAGADGTFLLFGGSKPQPEVKEFYRTDPLKDLWSYDPGKKSWTLLWGDVQRNMRATELSPGALEYHSVAGDANGNLLVFGGGERNVEKGFDYMNVLWRFDVQKRAWGKLTRGLERNARNSETGPGARMFHSMALDKEGNVFVFGGFGVDRNEKDGHLQDLWKFDLKTEKWTLLSGSLLGDVKNSDTGPGGRSGSALVFDREGNLLLFGGRGLSQAERPQALDELWKFEVAKSRWTKLAKPEVAPSARYDFAWAASGDGGFYIHGGRSGNDLNESWKYDPATHKWELHPENKALSARTNHSMASDANGNAVLFGGVTFVAAEFPAPNFRYYQDVWRFDARRKVWESQ
jgi:N-acetylneuraminic acid mutarotase